VNSTCADDDGQSAHGVGSASVRGVFMSRRMQSSLIDDGVLSSPDDGDAKCVACEALLWKTTTTHRENVTQPNTKWVSYVWFYGTRPLYAPWLPRDAASGALAGGGRSDDDSDDDDGGGSGSVGGVGVGGGGVGGGGSARGGAGGGNVDGLFAAEASELASELLRRLVQGWAPSRRSLRFVNLPAVADSSLLKSPTMTVNPLVTATASGWVDLGGGKHTTRRP
jgi:hypothetical protein